MITRLQQSGSKGFTVVELLVVVAILGVLLAIGFLIIPRDRFAVNQAAEGTARDFQFIRLEAIRRNEFVALALTPGTDGYNVFIDMNRNLIFDSGTDDVIKVVELGQNGVSMTGTVATTLFFDPRGLNPNGFVGEIAVRLSNAADTYVRFVCVNTQGRTRIEAGGCA